MTPRYCGALAILLTGVTLGARPQTPAPPPTPLVPSTSYTSKSRKPEPTPILPVEEVWSVEFEAAPAANAWMDDERVYVGLESLGVRALTRSSGEPLWQQPVDITHPPLAVGDDVLIAMPEEIRALDAKTGELRWAQALNRPLGAPMSANDGVVLLASDAGELTALRAATGEVVWRRSLGALSPHPPARPWADTMVLALSDGRLVALDARTGELRWERALGGTLCAPAAARDRVLVGSSTNFFYALDPEDGSERWRWRTGGDVVGAAAFGDRVYFVSLDNVLRAVDRGNGNQLWKVAIPSRSSGAPVAFDDVVLVAAVAPRVDAWNARTGAALGTFTAPTDLAGVPLIDTTPTPFDVAIVALTRDGRLSALRPTGMMFPDPPLVPLARLPGRELPREPRPGAARLR